MNFMKKLKLLVLLLSFSSAIIVIMSSWNPSDPCNGTTGQYLIAAPGDEKLFYFCSNGVAVGDVLSCPPENPYFNGYLQMCTDIPQKTGVYVSIPHVSQFPYPCFCVYACAEMLNNTYNILEYAHLIQHNDMDSGRALNFNIGATLEEAEYVYYYGSAHLTNWSGPSGWNSVEADMFLRREPVPILYTHTCGGQAVIILSCSVYDDYVICDLNDPWYNVPSVKNFDRNEYNYYAFKKY